MYPLQKNPPRMRNPEEVIFDEDLIDKVVTSSSKSAIKGLEKKKGAAEQERVGDGYGSDDPNEIKLTTTSRQGPNTYNSYHKYNPGQFEEDSPEWQMAMLQYLLDMKNNGHDIQEVTNDKV